MISLVIPGVPAGKGRPRFARAGAFVRAYTPAKTVSMENLIRLTFAHKYPGRPPISGAVTVDVRAYFPIPKSVSKKLAAKMAEEKFPYTHKPDADNILKMLDALTGIAFEDDRFIYRAEVWKYYSNRPRLEIDICEMDDLKFPQGGK